MAPRCDHAAIGNVPWWLPGGRVRRSVAVADVEHAAGAERDLGPAGPDATLADEGSLLVPDQGGDRRGAGQRRGVADDAGGVDQRGEDPGRDAQGVEDAVVPARPVGLEQPGHGGVGVVGDVQRAARQRPRQPRVDGAGAEVPVGRARGRRQQPGDLRRRLVRGEGQPVLGLGRDALVDRAQVLPAQGGADRLARGAVPDDRAGPLVGDADGVDVAAGGGQRLAGGGQREAGELGGVELDQPGERRRGRRLPPGHGDHVEAVVDDRRPQRRGADVEDQDHGDDDGRSGGTIPRLSSSWPTSPPSSPAPSANAVLKTMATTSTSAPRTSRTTTSTIWIRR